MMGRQEFYELPNNVYGDLIADVYDQTTQPINDVGNVVEFLLDHAGGGRYLELGVGTGRVAIPLSEKADVVGLDSSAEMLRVLRGKDVSGRVETIQRDLADLDGLGSFDCVYAVYNSFNVILSQEAQLECLKGCRELLRPGGCLVLEMNAPNAALFETGPRVREMSPGEVVLQVKSIDFVEQRLILQRIALGTSQSVIPWVTRYIWPAELRLMGQVAGFSEVEQFDGWSGRPLQHGMGTIVTVLRN
jgi:SAM-dependent methyltransferase